MHQLCSFLSEQCGFCVSGPRDSFLSDALTGFCAAAYAMVLRAFLLFVVVELGLAAVSHANACLREAEVSPKNKSACLGGTFCLHAGCHSFCDKDSRDASAVTAQEKAYECAILPNHCCHPGLVEANSTLS